MSQAQQTQSIVKNVVQDYQDDKLTRKAAAIAFFAVLAFAPTVVVAILIIQWVTGDSLSTGQLTQQIGTFVGQGNAQAIEQAVSSVQDSGWLTGTISFLSLAVAMVGVVRLLKESLNEIWGLHTSSDDAPEEVAQSNVKAFFIVTIVGILLVLSVGTGAWAGSLGTSSQQGASTGLGTSAVGLGVNLIITAILATVVYAIMYKFVPDVSVDWKNIWTGAIIGGVAFSIGTLLVSWYIGASTAMQSSYGLFGSMVIVLIWVFYSTVVMLIGAEFVQERTHSRVLA